MATISPSNFQTIADNIAKSLLDIQTTFVTNPGSVSPTVTTITAGQNGASNSLQAHVASLNDLAQETALASSATTAVANMVASLPLSLNSWYDNYRTFLLALENHTGGINAFLTTNTVLVHEQFKLAFNRMASLAVSLGLATSAPTSIAAANCFVPATQTLSSIAVTGAAAGTYSAGTPVDTTKYAAAQLYLKNTAGGATGGTATSFTITYTNAAGQTGQTATQALSGALAAGATLAIAGAIGSAVSNIVVNSGGVAADAIAVVVQPLRTVAY